MCGHIHHVEVFAVQSCYASPGEAHSHACVVQNCMRSFTSTHLRKENFPTKISKAHSGKFSLHRVVFLKLYHLILRLDTFMCNKIYVISQNGHNPRIWGRFREVSLMWKQMVQYCGTATRRYCPVAYKVIMALSSLKEE